jgi:hypothetical protein
MDIKYCFCGKWQRNGFTQYEISIFPEKLCGLEMLMQKQSRVNLRQKFGQSYPVTYYLSPTRYLSDSGILKNAQSR